MCRLAEEATEFGFYYGASESDVIEKLGRPTTISIDKDGLSKMLSFARYRATFEFVQARSIALCAASNGNVRYVVEYALGTPQ